MKRRVISVIVCAIIVAYITTAMSRSATRQAGQGRHTTHIARTTKTRQVEINLDKALPVMMPQIQADLQPVAFKTPDHKAGWVLRIPGNRPIATPAYADGRLFVGGGYGSYEFYAFNADTGKVAWQIHTKDDGPTAAVVEDGYVAFNTESCTVCVVDARTGRIIWQEWLGDPLMSQPAISRGRLYIAYPAGQRSNAPVQQQAIPSNHTEGIKQADSGSNAPYRLLCADLKTGKHLWTQGLPADVISAPVIEGERVLITCFDGTSFSLDAITGAVIWRKKTSGTSAPLVVNGDMVLSLKEQVGGMAYEGIKRLDVRAGAAKDRQLLAGGGASYLQANRGGGVAVGQAAQAALDSSVGFAGGAPSGAQMSKANAHLGVNSVVGGWAYQGSRVAYSGGQIMNAQGRWLNALHAGDGHMQWRAEAKGKDVGTGSQIFSPPALGRKNLYLCTAQGHLLSVGQQDGHTNYLYATGQPIAFQPALARGNIYVGTVNGLLLCLKTGDKDADGWSAWGGNAQHNKKN